MASDAEGKVVGPVRWIVGAALVALAAAVAVFMLLRGGGSAEEAGPVDPYDTQYARMHDPEYLKQLAELREEQRGVAEKLADAHAAVEAAKAKGEDSPEYKAALAKMAAAKDEFQRNRAKAQLVVGERIRRENDAIEAKQGSSNRKGE